MYRWITRNDLTIHVCMLEYDVFTTFWVQDLLLVRVWGLGLVLGSGFKVS